MNKTFGHFQNCIETVALMKLVFGISCVWGAVVINCCFNETAVWNKLCMEGCGNKLLF